MHFEKKNFGNCENLCQMSFRFTSVFCIRTLIYKAILATSLFLLLDVYRRLIDLKINLVAYYYYGNNPLVTITDSQMSF